jgi:hypothetical protein
MLHFRNKKKRKRIRDYILCTIQMKKQGRDYILYMIQRRQDYLLSSVGVGRSAALRKVHNSKVAFILKDLSTR